MCWNKNKDNCHWRCAWYVHLTNYEIIQIICKRGTLRNSATYWFSTSWILELTNDINLLHLFQIFVEASWKEKLFFLRGKRKAISSLLGCMGQNLLSLSLFLSHSFPPGRSPALIKAQRTSALSRSFFFSIRPLSALAHFWRENWAGGFQARI